jgi:hypothetical protein
MKNKSDFLLKLHSSGPAIFHRELLLPVKIMGGEPEIHFRLFLDKISIRYYGGILKF